jgi:hypothetical protein
MTQSQTPPTETLNPKKRPWLLHLISDHPFGTLVIFLGAIAGIAGLALAFFPWWTAPKRALTYFVNPVRTPIVRVAHLEARVWTGSAESNIISLDYSAPT